MNFNKNDLAERQTFRSCVLESIQRLADPEWTHIDREVGAFNRDLVLGMENEMTACTPFRSVELDDLTAKIKEMRSDPLRPDIQAYLKELLSNRRMEKEFLE